jgi:hypothetical protein
MSFANINDDHNLAAEEGKIVRYYYDVVPNITAIGGLIDNILHHKVSQLSRVEARVIEEIGRKGGAEPQPDRCAVRLEARGAHVRLAKA